MIKLKAPVTATQTGSGRQDLITIGSDPLPSGDNNVRLCLLALDISVKYAPATVIVRSGTGGTILYKKSFGTIGASTDETVRDTVSCLNRWAQSTHSITLQVEDAAGSAVITAVAEIGFEYSGGSKIASV